jgi:hypothetical protein
MRVCQDARPRFEGIGVGTAPWLRRYRRISGVVSMHANRTASNRLQADGAYIHNIPATTRGHPADGIAFT